MPDSTEHVMEIGTDFILGDWTVACSCGWGGPMAYAHKADAVDAWDNHNGTPSGSTLAARRRCHGSDAPCAAAHPTGVDK